MSTHPEPAAVTIARAHVEAWSNHDFDTARKGLAPDVHVTASTTMDRTAADRPDWSGRLHDRLDTVCPGRGTGECPHSGERRRRVQCADLGDRRGGFRWHQDDIAGCATLSVRREPQDQV